MREGKQAVPAMKRIAVCGGGLLFLLAAAALFSAFTHRQEVVIRAYLYDPCGGCSTEESGCKPCDAIDAMSLAGLEEAERQGADDRISFVVENTRSARVRETVDALCDTFGIDGDSINYPLVIVDDKRVFQGPRAVEDAVSAAKGMGFSLSFFRPAPISREPEPTGDMLYFYSELCADCHRAEAVLETLLPALEAEGAVLRRYSIEEEDGYDRFTEARRLYLDAGSQAVVPLLIWKGSAYAGSEEMEALAAELTRDGGD